MKTKCLSCERMLLPEESINCKYCVEKGATYSGFKTADVGDGNGDW
jgi:hypothetical protein